MLIGIAGAPGSGKSTLAEQLADTLGGDECVVVPMDGFHLAQRVIAETPLADRRGAIDTFDGWGFAHLVGRIAHQGDEPIYAPEFRRGLEEPIAAAIEVRASVPIVVIEGNYLLVDDEPWRSASRLLTERWFVETDEAQRLDRLTARHVAAGKTPAAARAWAEGPDAANAAFIDTTKPRADLIVRW